MGDTIRCDDCGAAARNSEEGPGRDKFCRFCGAAFRPDEPAPTVVVHESRDEERARRFEELAAHPKVRRALRSAPSAAPAIAKHGTGLIFLLVALGMAVVVGGFQCSVANEVQRGFGSFGSGVPHGFPGGGTFSTIERHGPGAFAGLFKLVPLVIVGFILFRVIRSAGTTANVARSRTRSWLAAIVDESTETHGSGDHRRTVTVLTLERENGSRSSYEVSNRLARKVTRDDMGVAHSRGGELLGFKRIAV